MRYKTLISVFTSSNVYKVGSIPLLFAFGLGSFSVAFSNDFKALPSSSRPSIIGSPKEVIDQVWQIVYRDFLDSSGQYSQSTWKALRMDLLSRKYVDKSDSYQAIREMLESLDDPYTRFLDPQEFKEMKIDTSGELSGVGIRLALDEKSGRLLVVSPIDATPAFRAGVKSNDIINSIDGKSTDGMNIQNAVRLIRGKEGSRVTLGLLRNGVEIDVILTRARIEINAVDSHLNHTKGGLKIGFIRLKQFNANSAKEMRKAIKELESNGALGYILDLRGNPGGLLEASVDIARQLLDKGTIVSTETREGIHDIRRAVGRALTTRPLVLLVDKGSASASEILSGAIQDNKRGLLVGEKTFGKGLVQSVRSLSDGSGITVTIARYLTPKGIDIHKNGILPDISVSLTETELLNLRPEHLGTEKDSQYKVGETSLIKLLNGVNKLSSYSPTNYKLVMGLSNS